MNGRAYYNEIDPFAAAWLRELIKRGLIADGDVDERSIVNLRAGDINHYRQFHFFAGIGGWSLALRLAEWPDNRVVVTGSCPCQPLSSAGHRKGHADQRHLWPAFHNLIDQLSPSIVFGEQVASKDGREWLSGVRADLEALGYAVGAADLCAAGVSAPHIRSRLYWLADAYSGREYRQRGQEGSAPPEGQGEMGQQDRKWFWLQPRGDSQTRGMGDAERRGRQGGPAHRASPGKFGAARDARRPWDHHEILPFGDGRLRRVEPDSFPLADGFPSRVGRLRGYGNAIVPQVAAQFIGAYLDRERELTA